MPMTRPVTFGFVGWPVAEVRVHCVVSSSLIGGALSFMHRRVPGTDARPEVGGRRQGEGRAEVRKSDRRPARVLRDVAFAAANQVLEEPEAIPEA